MNAVILTSKLVRALLAQGIILMVVCTVRASGENESGANETADINAVDSDVSLAEGLLRYGPAEMSKRFPLKDPEYYLRLDAWLARGSLRTEMAARRSPKALLEHVERTGIHHESCVAGTYTMLAQFNGVYQNQLRVKNKQAFPNAEALADSISVAMNAVNDYLCLMCWERSYHGEIICGQAEWLLHQAKAEFVAKKASEKGGSGKLWATLRHELEFCRGRDGQLASEDWSRSHFDDLSEMEACLKKIRTALKPWNDSGKNYLLTELILLTRDRNYYLYGGAEEPRSTYLIHASKGPLRKSSTGPFESMYVGKCVATFSSGRREILDKNPHCSMPTLEDGSVAWICNVRKNDTPSTAKQSMGVFNQGENHRIKPRGGWVADFRTSNSGASIMSIDEKGEAWIEFYDFEEKKITETYRKGRPEPAKAFHRAYEFFPIDGVSIN